MDNSFKISHRKARYTCSHIFVVKNLGVCTAVCIQHAWIMSVVII